MPRTLLIIDDSESTRTRLREVLAAKGLFERFLLASSGTEGLRLMLDNPVDMVICDLMMPGIDGFKFLHLKQAQHPYREVPLIMLTGHDMVANTVRGLEAGASDCLTKPFHDEELVARVQVHLKLKQLQDELREKHAALEQISRTDPLTGVANRRHFMEVLEQELARARRYESCLSFVMVDLDHFKQINDGWGHQLGDQALASVASTLQAQTRIHDLVGRYGGEELVLLLPQTDAQDGYAVAERCRRAIEHLELPHDGQPVRVTASFGVATHSSADVDRVDDLIRWADSALYESKRAGRNRVTVARNHSSGPPAPMPRASGGRRGESKAR